MLTTKAVELLRGHVAAHLENSFHTAQILKTWLFVSSAQKFCAESLGRRSRMARHFALDSNNRAKVGAMDLGFLSVSIYHDNYRSTTLME